MYDYDVRVPCSTVRTAVFPETSHPAGHLRRGHRPAGRPHRQWLRYCTVVLGEGATTTAAVSVTAQDGAPTQNYVVRAHRAGPKKTQENGVAD